MPTIFFRVTGLRDAGDERRVETALRAEPGVYGAVASREESCAEIDFDDGEVTIGRMAHVIASVGFQATLAG